MQKITPCLWFDDQAEEAANFYISLFPNSKIVDVFPYPEGSPRPAGTAMLVTFQLDGEDFEALNGGPEFKFTEAVSMSVPCESQEEIDRLWDGLLEGGGEELECGWLKDRYGLPWQIVPAALGEWLHDPERSQRVMAALLQMKKLDIRALQEA